MSSYSTSGLHKIGGAVLMFAMAFGTFAPAANAQVYQPGETLNPGCAPTDDPCTVATSTGSFSSNPVFNNVTVQNIAATGTATLGSTSVTSLSIGSLTGILRAAGGAVSTGLVALATEVAGILGIANGGTGLARPPLPKARFLVGNGTGGYMLVATSSLGIAGGANSTTTNLYTQSGIVDDLVVNNTFKFGNLDGILFANGGDVTALANAANPGYVLSTNASGDLEWVAQASSTNATSTHHHITELTAEHATTTSIYSPTGTFDVLTVNNSLTLTGLNGLLFANNGAVSDFANSANPGYVLSTNALGELEWVAQASSTNATSTHHHITELTAEHATTTSIYSPTGTFDVLTVNNTLQVLGDTTLATTTVRGLTATHNGITLASSTPGNTANTLYNEGGVLYWNGTAVGGGPDLSGDVTIGGNLTVNGATTTVNSLLWDSSYSSAVEMPDASAHEGMVALRDDLGQFFASYAGDWLRLVHENINGDATITNGLTVTSTSTALGFHATGNGLAMDSATPVVTANTLYNQGGTLYWNGAAVATNEGGGYTNVLDDGSWKANSRTLPASLTRSQIAVIGDTVYLFGGHNGSSDVNTIYSAPVSNPTAWTNTGQVLPGSVSQAQVVVIGDFIYLLGGSAGKILIYRASVSTPTDWHLTSSVISPSLANSHVAVIGDYVYLFGGVGSSAIRRAPVTNLSSWSTVGNLPNTLHSSQLAVIGDSIYLFGGTGSVGATNAIYQASVNNPASWHLVTTGFLPVPLTESQLAIVGDYVYLFGGYNGSTQISTIYRAPVSDPIHWSNTGSTLPTNLALSQTAVIGDYVYLFGGHISSATSVIYSANITSRIDDNAVVTTHGGMEDKMGWKYLPNSSNSSTASYFAQNGNSFGGIATLGTNDVYGLALETSGIERFLIDALGNVGIGTSTPTNKLHVDGAITIASTTPITTANALYNLNGALHWNGSALGGTSTSTGALTGGEEGYLTFWNTDTTLSTSTLFYDTASGNIGVGTTNPANKLAVAGGISIASTTPVTTTNALYNLGGVLYWNGSAVTSEDGSNYTSVLDNGDWKVSGAIPFNISNSQTAVIGDYVYLFGGLHNGGPTNAIYRAPATNPTAWTNTNEILPTPLYNSQTAVIGDSVYLFGGNDGFGSSQAIYSASTTDPTTWISVGMLPDDLEASQVAVIGNHIYLFGGTAHGSATNLIYRASVSTPTTWLPVAVLPDHLGSSQLAVIGNDIYLFGGVNGAGTTVSTIYHASVSAPTNWLPVGALPIALDDSQLAVIGNYVYLFGGVNSVGTTINSIYRAPVSNPTSWAHTGNNLPSPFSYSQLAIIGDYAYLFGGFNGSAYANTIYSANITSRIDDSAIVTNHGGMLESNGWKYLPNGSNFNSTTPNTANYFVQDGNSFGGLAMLGTNDAHGLALETSGLERFRIDALGNVGIGTTTPSHKLTVDGSFSIGNHSVTGQGQATSTIWGDVIIKGRLIVNGDIMPGLHDTYSLGTTTNQWNEVAVSSSTIYIGGVPLSTNGDSLYWNGVEVNINGGSAVVNNNSGIPAGLVWQLGTSPEDHLWHSVTYGNGIFVAVASSGTGNRVMTSPDGVNWTSRTSATDNDWSSVTYGNGLFVAVSTSGTGSNRVMTSPDGITWTSRVSASGNLWYDVTYGNGIFVAVASSGTGNRVMTSPDGITWTSRTSASNNNWYDVTYGNGLFVAVAYTGSGNRVMTSPDGITWTSRTSAADNEWYSVTYGNGLFVAVAASGGGGGRVMTSPDGITWTLRTVPQSEVWHSVTYGNGLFVAVSTSGDHVMTSPDGITWTASVSVADIQWHGVTYGNGIFVAVASSGTGNRVMTSGVAGQSGFALSGSIGSILAYNASSSLYASNALYVAPNSGNIGIGTTSPTNKLHVDGAITLGLATPATTTNALYNQGGTLYWNGSVLGGSSATTSAYTYALTNSSWQTSSNTLPSNLTGAQTAVIGNYIYLFGGFNGSAHLNTIYRAPVTSPTNWTNTGSVLPGTLVSSQTAVIGNYVYLFGGINSSSMPTNTIYSAPVANPTSWTATSTLPNNLGYSQTAVIGNYVYLFGGNSDGFSATSTIYRAPVTNPTNWSNAGALPVGLQTSQVAVIGEHVYLFGGHNSSGSSNVIYRASVANPTTWTNVGVLPGTLQNSQVAVVGDHIYLFGGFNGSAHLNTIYHASVTSPTSWTNTGLTLPTALAESQVAIVGNRIYLFGGYANPSPKNTIYFADITSVADSNAVVTGHGSMTSSNGWRYLPNSAAGSGSSGVGSFAQGGNSLGGLATLGTNDFYGLALETSGIERIRVSAAGNVGIGTTTPSHPLHMASGAHVTAGGAWTNSSDKNLKENFVALNAEEVLGKIMGLEVSRWNYKVEASSTMHIGPMAQDFFAAFGLGGSDTSISTIDPAGVALLGIQGLNEKVEGLAFLNASTTDEMGEKTFVGRFFDRLSVWFGDTANGIATFFAAEVRTDRLCLTDSNGDYVCLTSDDISDIGTKVASTTPAVPAEDQDDAADVITITVNGANPAEVVVGETYVDDGAEASGAETPVLVRTYQLIDGVLTEVSVVSIDTSATGTQHITYRVLNEAGEVIAEAVRLVQVVEATSTEGTPDGQATTTTETSTPVPLEETEPDTSGADDTAAEAEDSGVSEGEGTTSTDDSTSDTSDSEPDPGQESAQTGESNH